MNIDKLNPSAASPTNNSSKPTLNTIMTTSPNADSGNPFDDPAMASQVSAVGQQAHLLGSPRSVTTNANTGATAGVPQGQPPAMPPFGANAAATAASAPPQPQPSAAAQNPFDDPEILRSVVGGNAPAQTSASTSMRPPLAGSIGGSANAAQHVRPGHRPSRTLCTSELSSVAARAAASAAVYSAPMQTMATPATLHSSATTTPTNQSSPTHSNPHSTLSTPPSASPPVPSKQTVQALSELAAALSSARPRANTAEEAQEEAAALARVTLGEYAADSTGDRRSHAAKKVGHRRIGSGGGGGGGVGVGMADSNVAVSPGSSLTKKSGGASAGHRRSGSMDKFKSLLTASPSGKSPSPLTISPMRHRKSASLNTADMMDLVDSINEAGGGSRSNSIAHGKGAKIFGSMMDKMSPRGAGRGSIGGSSKGSAGSDGLGGSRDKIELPSAPSITVVGDDDKKLKDSSHGAGGGMRDMYQARRKEAAAGGGNPFVSETSLLGTDFIPSVPDLDVLVGKLDGGDGSIDTPSESESVADAVKGGGSGDEVRSHDSSHSDKDDENTDDAVPFKTNSLTHLPPPSAVESETLPSMRSSEQEPAPHQVEIPPIGDFVLHAKLCNVLDEYRKVDQNFDFASLVGMDRKEMEDFVNNSGKGSTMLQESHQPIVSSILECGDDLVVEGFVHEVGSCSHGDAQDDTGTARDKAPDDRVEAAIFYSAKNRQFIVAWRGPNHDQAKPVRNRHLKAAKDMLTHDPHSINLSAEQGVPVFPAYRDSYLKPGIEEGVFALLDELADRTPFCDVVMTGHSYGAALATLAGARYASSRSQLRVCYNLFGSPKVGGVEFRLWTNSLPNLKVMRVEYGSDPWVMAPEGTPWSHVGHSILIDSAVNSVSEKNFKMDNLHPKLGDHAKKNVEERKVPVISKAYRFDQHRPSSSAGKQFLSTVAKSMTGGHHVPTKSEKNDHELSVYVYAVERIASLNIPWVSDFVGEDAGEGLVGKNGHDRRMFV